MSVSIVIPTFNCAPFIGETIRSALDQSSEPQEVLVVDDGSTDDTDSVLRRFASRIAVHRQANQGVAVARNSGMDLATGEWILFLDADDVLEPRALEQLQAGHTGRERVVYGHCTHIDVTGAWIREHRSRDCTGPVGSAARQCFGGAAFVPGCAIVRADLAREIRFDQRFAPCEDRDFWIRCGTRTEFAEVPHEVLRYRVRPGSHSSHRARQVVQSVAVRLRALEWFEQTGAAVKMELSRQAILDTTLEDVYWQREWHVVDRLLEFAAEKSLESPTTSEIRRKRRIPPWIHRLKDSLDSAVKH
jgi:glycosyltransferase involved in cell wall biosynthesis